LLQDASRLLDICRQSIIFDDVPAMTACLRTITADPDAEILRVKNRLDPDFDSAQSAGYRDILLSLCIVTEETRDLGIDLHVCELQLLLRTFHALKVSWHKAHTRQFDS
jgi:hypothetical protein